ncbi:MAG: tetratricopeptide repeat protein [Cyclobacteriaceae bacterium]
MRILMIWAALICSFGLSAQEWLDQYNQSLYYYDNYELEEARNSAETAMAIFKAEVSEPHKNVAAILRHLSVVCYELYELDAAIDYAKKEVEALQALGLDLEENFTGALSNLALIRSARSEYEAAERLLQEALSLSRDFYAENSLEVALIKGNLGIAKFQLRQDDEAESLMETSLIDMEQYEEIPYDYYNILYNYSLLKASKGDYNTALMGYQTLEEDYAYDAPNFEYASILINVGDALDNLGKFNDAILKYETAMDNFAQIGEEESAEYGIAENNLALDLQKTGQFAKAKELLRNVYEKRDTKKENDPEAFVMTATNLGGLLLQEGETLESKEVLESGIETYESMGVAKDQIYLTALESLSKLELGLGNISEAEKKIELAITEAEAQQLSSKLYSLYNQKAKVLSSQGKFDDAKSTGDKALALSTATYGAIAIQTAFVQNTQAGILTELGQYDEAENLYAASMPTFAEVYGKTHPEYAAILSNYSSLLQLKGNYYAAESYLIEAVAINRTAFGEENPEYLTTYENLALLYSATARYIDAQTILEDVVTVKEAVLESKDPSLAYTYGNLGSLKKQTAEYPESEQYFSKARKIYEKSLGKEHILYAATINNLALLYQKMGNTNAAQPLFREALEIYANTVGKFTPDYASALSNLASLYQMEKNNEKAMSTLEEALEIDREILGTNHPSYAKTLNNLAALYEASESYELAKEKYRESLDIYANIFGENHPSYALTLYNLAVLEQALDNLEEAKSYYQKVVDIRRIILGEDHPDYAYAMYGLASISQKTGDFEAAKSNYKIVIDKYLENIQEYFPALSENEKSAFYGKIKPVFDAYMDFVIEYVERGYGTEVDRDEMLGSLYNLQLSTKALLLNATNKVRNRILNSGDQELIGLFQDWVALKENIVKSLSLSKEEVEENNIDIGAMEAEANDMEKQLSLKSSLFASEFEKKQIKWTDVQNQLNDDDAAVEIIRIRKNLKNDSILYASLIVGPDVGTSPKLILISNGDVLEDKGFRTYKNSIVYKIDDRKSYKLFWETIDKGLPESTKNIYLSADGIFNKVNILTLYDADKKEYIIEKYTIRLLSNTRELVEQSNEPNPTNTAQVFGYPAYNLNNVVTADAGGVADTEGMRYSFGDNVSELPGTLVELNNITEIMTQKSWKYNSYTRGEANEANIKKLESPKIFHVATHGFFLEDIPVSEDENQGTASRSQRFNPLMRSGLLFAGAENTIRDEDIPGEEDGILTAYEAMNLNLDNTDIVIMSACETGLGEVKNGEGVYGLQRAFIVAGAQNLIMSLWKVNDETTQLLMSEFYNQWFSGKSKTEAFNEAIIAVKKDFPKPYFWGAFVILGK